jgi:transcriptional regulator with XRE-family HTH domain
LTDYLSIGKRLRKIREKSRYSLHEVERLTEGEFKVGTLAGYETGKRKISIPRLKELADFYNISVSYFIDDEKVAESKGLYNNLSVNDLKVLEEKIKKVREQLEKEK